MPFQFVEFALAFYADKRVAGHLLAWQERFGIDINVVLYAIWLGAEKSAVAGEHPIRTADVAVAQWREQVIVPLRDARTWLKTHEDFDDQSRHGGSMVLVTAAADRYNVPNYGLYAA